MHDSLSAALAALRHTLTDRRHRGLLWADGEAAMLRERALSVWRGGTWQAPLWLGPASPADDLPALPAAKARTRLGGEHDLVVVDAATPGGGFDPEAFGAVAGTVRAGGLLLLLTPADWRTAAPRPDADYARLASWPHAVDSLSAHTLARLARCLRTADTLLHWPAEAERPDLTPPAAGEAAAPSSVTDPDCLSADQAEAVRRLSRLRRRRPLVISADRGRGKSAALGIAAARRLAGGERELWLTAPRPGAVEPVFERLAALLPGGRREANVFVVTTDQGPARLRFLPPDGVMAALAEAGGEPSAAPTLLVDEAAAIPAPLLGRWLAAFPRLAFATTVHGYEGTGRGFAVRFRERLARETPDWRACRLATPVRWAPGDPLEALTRELLLLDAEPADDDRVTAALATEPVQLAELDRAALARDTPALTELFGLLVQAHYRTTPGDLRQLLDAPDTRLLAARVGGHCVGVCLVQAEGGLPAALAAAVHHGERRPRGHLLAQSLAVHGGWREAAETRWWRIQRIAVHPAARRRGVGSRLLAAVAERARGAGIDALGTSFGGEPALLAFWRSRGYATLRLGLSREASSGEHAVMMGLPLHADARRRLTDWQAEFHELLPTLLAAELDELDAALIVVLLDEAPVPPLDTATPARLAWFAAGGGELALARPWLARAWRIARHRAPSALDEAEWQALAAPLFQGREVPAGWTPAGRKARLRHWRELAGRLQAALETTRPDKLDARQAGGIGSP